MPNVSYIEEGEGDVVLLLHGWGQNKEMMCPLIDELKYKYKCVVIDMPGFGASLFNNESNLDDYTHTLRSFLKEKKLFPKYIIGHSFGGKVALNYYLRYKDLSGLVIMASPLLKPTRTIKYYFDIYKYKLKKKLGFSEKNQGSEDYKCCAPNMRKFFVKIVNTHFDKEINKVKIPCLLIWGKEDKKVPLNKAKILNKKIINSELYIEKGGHFAYLENIEFTKLIIQKFMRGNIND
jgi:pimeloyl-ACP methyl ester carboxylesterase